MTDNFPRKGIIERITSSNKPQSELRDMIRGGGLAAVSLNF